MAATPLRCTIGEFLSAPAADALHDLIESEARRHEAGATLLPFEGGVIALTRAEDGCLLEAGVQRIRLAAIQSPIDEWLSAVTEQLRGLGVSVARVRLARRVFHLEAALRRHGYEPRPLRLVTAGTYDTSPTEAGRENLSGFIGHRFVLEAVKDEEDWGHFAALRGEDLALDRHKAEAGFSHPYLAWHEDRLCGGFSAAPAGAVLRIDHVVVDPARGGTGLTLAILEAARLLAADGGWRFTGSVLAADDPLLVTYRQTGFAAVGHLTEWIARLD